LTTAKREDGTLTQHLWERHWDKVQDRSIELNVLHLFDIYF
jgi:hypothetical protein